MSFSPFRFFPSTLPLYTFLPSLLLFYESLKELQAIYSKKITRQSKVDDV